jgi:hypothetical protein
LVTLAAIATARSGGVSENAPLSLE